MREGAPPPEPVLPMVQRGTERPVRDRCERHAVYLYYTHIRGVGGFSSRLEQFPEVTAAVVPAWLGRSSKEFYVPWKSARIAIRHRDASRSRTAARLKASGTLAQGSIRSRHSADVDIFREEL